MFRPQIFTLSALTLALFSQSTVVSGAVTGAEDTELNTGFLQGVSVVPSVFKSGVNYPAGQYYVDVVVNNDNVGKASLTIPPKKKKLACCACPRSG